ncbi:hypothetical protein BX616_011022 [Lobosporangium transversale]|nr:hypothetical protein BX616_011022 [Lobosporangium transversale]
MPIFWRHMLVDLFRSNQIPPISSYHRHGHLVKKLALQGTALHYSLVFSAQLCDLALASAMDLCGSILQGKVYLTSLCLDRVRFLDASGFWQTVSTNLHRLQHLIIRDTVVDFYAVPHFWMICQRIETLKLIRTTLAYGPDPTMEFRKLQVLVVKTVKGITKEELKQWVIQSNHLKRFEELNNDSSEEEEEHMVEWNQGL